MILQPALFRYRYGVLAGTGVVHAVERLPVPQIPVHFIFLVTMHHQQAGHVDATVGVVSGVSDQVDVINNLKPEIRH